MMPSITPPITSLPIETVDTIVQETESILGSAVKIPQLNSEELEGYKTICEQIPGLMKDGLLKIAVVGVIKSGKSTFVNALAGKEVVRRGAGVMTSVTTRIRKGKKNQARLFFKSWDDVNDRLQKALMLFPDKSDDFSENRFDIRRKKNREYLESVFLKLMDDFPAPGDEINPETLLIRHALKGYEVCSELVQADESITCFQSKQFDLHKTYTSDPERAFYIKDVCLDIYGKTIGSNIEIADCQGADSTDPAQLGQVLSYLESANLIVYCISSRTGLRQADIMFLKRIQRLGRLNNILFVNNCDLSEHENLDDLMRIESGIREDLKFLKIQPEIFSISALYNLFKVLGSRLNTRDRARLELWQSEKKLADYCEKNNTQFNHAFRQAVEKDRNRLLISNHLSRIYMILRQVEKQTGIALDLLSSDRSRQESAGRALEDLHRNATRLEAVVANSIDGAVAGLSDEVQVNFKAMFAKDSHNILADARTFLQDFSVDLEPFRSTAGQYGFNRVLYLLFQEIRRGLDLHVAESALPKIRGFVGEQETRISEYFHSLFSSYQIDISKNDQLPDELPGRDPSSVIEFVDIDEIKKILGLEMPHVILKAEYTPVIRVNTFVDFSFQTLVQILKSLFKKRETISFTPALARALHKIKRENLKLLEKQFSQCRQEIENNYFTPLIEAAVRDFKEKIRQRFKRYHSFREEMEGLLELKQSEKDIQKKNILDLKSRIQSTAGKIEQLDLVL